MENQYDIKNLYKKFTIQEIVNMDKFDQAEVTCKRMMVKFRNLFATNRTNIRIKPTPSTTIYDAKLLYINDKGEEIKAHCEFKTREKIYEEMYIEPKNVNYANYIKTLGIEYLYINFYDDLKTKTRHMYIWSSYVIDFNNLASEMKEIGVTEVEDNGTKYQKRFKLSLKDASEHYTLPVTELWAECQTQEYIDAILSKLRF